MTALAKNTAIAVAFSVFEATAILRRLQNQFASATSAAGECGHRLPGDHPHHQRSFQL
jgi:hypothetical protein